MKRVYIYVIILLILFCKVSYAQYVDLNDNCKPMLETGLSQDVLNHEMLPQNIQEVTRIILEERFGNLSGGLKFKSGKIYQLDSLGIMKDSHALALGKAIPMFEMIYSLSIPKIQLKSLCVKISLDQYGQVLSVDWPRYKYTDEKAFQPIYFLKKKATDYAVLKSYGDDISFSSLIFNDADDAVYAEFWFLQAKENNEGGKSLKSIEVYRVVSINIITNEVAYDKLRHKQNVNIIDKKIE